MQKPYFTEIWAQRPAHLGADAWRLRNLTGITVLFGKNGSGKSQLLRALRDQDPNSRHYVVPERTGEIEYNPNHLQAQIDPQMRKSNAARNYVENYRSQIITRVHAYLTARGNFRGGQLPGDPARLEELINLLLPDFTASITGTARSPLQLTRTSNGQTISNIDQLSSGESQLLTVALDILTIAAIWDIEDQKERLLLIDEPDAHIHPDLQVRFADFLIQVIEEFKLQVIVATHSTSLLAALGQFGGDGTSVIYVDRKTLEYRAERFTNVSRELTACLGGSALMGPLFGAPLLLVEGDDDFRVWSQVPRYHMLNLAVIPSNGDQIHQYQRTLERMFRSLRGEDGGLAGYALIDGDKGKPVPSPQVPQDQIRYIRLDCHETENLYLTDEVLSIIGTTWEEAAEKIAKTASKYGEKSPALAAISQLGRDQLMQADIKSSIAQVAEMIDPKRVHWTLRIAQAIGRERPSGSLAAFLGPEVVQSLWGVNPDHGLGGNVR